MPSKTQHKEIPLSGKFYTTDPAAVGTNFQTLKNMRYTDTHIKGVGGMAKINVTAMTTAIETKSAFHFKKSQPSESHVVAQVRTTAGTTSELKENTAVVPGTAAFTATAIWTDSTGFGLGRFSYAPDGQMIYANGVDSCIWGGDEMKLGSFITSTAAVTDTGSATNPKDYTDIINNTKSDAENVAIIGGGIDIYTVLMAHFNGDDGSTANYTSEDTNAHTMTQAGTAQLDSEQAKFGTTSAKLDGNSDYYSVSDSDGVNDYFDLSAGAWTIDFWYRANTLPGAGADGLVGQYEDVNNYFSFYYSDSVDALYFESNIGGAGATSGDWSVGTAFTTGQWYHIAFVSDGANIKCYVNGTQVGATATDTWADIGGSFEVGRGYSTGSAAFLYCDGWLDEVRVSKGIARWTANFTPPARPYSAAARTWLVGSPRPLKGLKYTVSLANSVASAMTGSEWSGTTWNTLTLTDNTDTGASLATTGTVTFNSTVDTAKPKYLEGSFLYWYQFAIDAGGAEISHVTIDAPFQNIVDMWDGVFRDVARFYKYTTAYLDNTINVLYDDYDSASAITYSNLSSMGAFSTPNNALEIGFFEKQTGLKIDVAPEYTNSTAATTMAIDYWDGTAYVSAGTITDGTSEGAISLAKSGVVSWNNNSLSNETLKVVSNSPPLYYYRVRFDKAMDASVRVNYVGGISAQKEINYFKFPVFAQGRILLCGDMAGEKNKAVVSGRYMPQVYNGTDSVDVYFGEEGELTCGTELFSQFGSSLYSLVLMFKDNEVWVVAGTDIDQWENNTFLLSSSIGCPAPLTLKTINLHAEPGAGINRSLAIWQGANGIFMSDGRAPIPIHGDIKEYFDKQDSRCITASMVGDSVGFLDKANQEYHWLFASGTAATTLNTELVYDIARNKWFEVDRTADLQCGVEVTDTDGNDYAYGFLDTGYMERLENGLDFDGTDIIHTFQTGDIAFAGLATETRLSAIRLISKQKTTDATVTFSHYPDGSTTNYDVSMNTTNASGRIAQAKFTEKLDGDPFHSLKFTITTDDAVPGFEPLAVVVSYHPTHEDN